MHSLSAQAPSEKGSMEQAFDLAAKGPPSLRAAAL